MLQQLQYFLIRKTLDIRLIVNGQQVGHIIFEENMCDHPCTTGFSFAFAGNGQANFVTVIANGGSLCGLYGQFVDECLEFPFKGRKLLNQSFGLVVKDSYGLNPKAH